MDTPIYEQPLSASRIDTLCCPYKFYLSYVLNLEPIEPPPEYLHAGSVGHIGVYHWHHSEQDDTWALDCAQEAWGDYTGRGEYLPDGTKNTYAYLTWEYVEDQVLRRYFNYYRDKINSVPVKLEVGGQTLEAEKRVQVTLPNGIEYVVLIDYIHRENGTDKLIIDDFKLTTGNVGYALNGHSVSLQLRGYSQVLKQETGELPRVRLNGVYMGKSKRTDEAAMQIQTFEYMDWSLDEFLQAALYTKRELHWRSECQFWEQRASKQNCSNCSFLKACQAGPRLRQGILDQDFRQKQRQGHGD